MHNQTHKATGLDNQGTRHAIASNVEIVPSLKSQRTRNTTVVVHFYNDIITLDTHTQHFHKSKLDGGQMLVSHQTKDCMLHMS